MPEPTTLILGGLALYAFLNRRDPSSITSWTGSAPPPRPFPVAPYPVSQPGAKIDLRPQMRAAYQQAQARGSTTPGVDALKVAQTAIGLALKVPAVQQALGLRNLQNTISNLITSKAEPEATKLATNLMIRDTEQVAQTIEAAVPEVSTPVDAAAAVDSLPAIADAEVEAALGMSAAEFEFAAGFEAGTLGELGALAETGTLIESSGIIAATEGGTVLGAEVTAAEVAALQLATSGLATLGTFATGVGLVLAVVAIMEIAGAKTIFHQFRTNWQLFAGRLRETLAVIERALQDLINEIKASRTRGDLYLSVQNYNTRMARGYVPYGSIVGDWYHRNPYLYPEGPGQEFAGSWAPFEANPTGLLAAYLITPPGATGTSHEGGVVRNYEPIMGSIRTLFLAEWRRLPLGGPSGAVENWDDNLAAQQRTLEAADYAARQAAILQAVPPPFDAYAGTTYARAVGTPGAYVPLESNKIVSGYTGEVLYDPSWYERGGS